MHDKKLLDSDFTHLHKFLNLKVRKNFLLVPFFSNILFWMLFSSLLEVKLFDRELVKKMKKSYFRRLILPLLIFVVFIIPWWVWTILTHSHTGFATFAYSKFSLLIWALSPLVIFFILNPIFIHTRNSYIKKVYENMKTNGQLIEDPIEVVSINSWDAYLHSYLWGIKKNRWRSRASDNFEVKIAEEKIPYYNIAPSKKLGWNYKKQKNKNISSSASKFFWATGNVLSWFASFNWLSYLTILLENKNPELSLKTTIFHKYLLSSFIAFLYWFGFFVCIFFWTSDVIYLKDTKSLTLEILFVPILLSIHLIISFIKNILLKIWITWSLKNSTNLKVKKEEDQTESFNNSMSNLKIKPTGEIDG